MDTSTIFEATLRSGAFTEEKRMSWNVGSEPRRLRRETASGRTVRFCCGPKASGMQTRWRTRSWYVSALPSVSKWSQALTDARARRPQGHSGAAGPSLSIPLFYGPAGGRGRQARRRPAGRRWKHDARWLGSSARYSAHSVARIWQSRRAQAASSAAAFKVSRDKLVSKRSSGMWWVSTVDPTPRNYIWCCAATRRRSARPWSGIVSIGPAVGPAAISGRGHDDYIRHGTVTLFAALSYLEGKLIYRTEQQHGARGVAAFPSSRSTCDYLDFEDRRPPPDCRSTIATHKPSEGGEHG